MGQYAPLNKRSVNSLYDLGIHWKEQERIINWALGSEFKHQTSNNLVVFLYKGNQVS